MRYRDPNNRPRERWFSTAADARIFAKTVDADVVRGNYLNPTLGRTRFAYWADQWFATTAGLKPKTRQGYESMLRVHVVPHFGGWQISAVDTPAVRAFLAKMSDAGSAVGTQRAARKVLRLVLGTAIEGNAIMHNPCDGVRLARSQREEMVFLTLDEVHALATAMRRPEYGLLVRFVTLTGLRAGEVGALRVGRLDLLRGRVDVVEAVSEVTGHGLVYGPTKTYERRSVPIPRAMCDELGAYLATRPADPEAFIFTAPDGGPLRHHNFYARHFRPAVVAARLPERMRFHDLRHTCAALLINAEPPAHPLAVMKRLGHSSITVTYDTYGHLFPALEEALTDSLDRSYRQSRARAGERDPRGSRVVEGSNGSSVVALYPS
ncbi:MAG: tyrosine recombinase XerC [Acidimicrobiales bacterium]